MSSAIFTGAKITALQLSALLGLIAGALVAPDALLYPFSPSAAEYAVIQYNELHIFLLMGFFSGLVSFGVGRLMRFGAGLCFATTFVAVAIYAGLEAARQRLMLSVSVSNLAIYVAAVFSAFGMFQAAVLALKALHHKRQRPV